ncbi:NAPDH-dependent diflavin reductase [Lithohypha guttulata]|uniref:NAPDH-dependent diflavin reductase n=1 Tax=Lithohypha guttulata TaxID=1690604 RepID=UPI002DE0094B|nr:NAPDH-dependent diflavin reductase [Lithohypha guttulata]
MIQVPAPRSALILYGTETGNSQDIAYELGQCLERIHFATKIRELDGVSIPDLPQYDLLVFAISTTGQGDFPSNARKFWLSLLRKKLPLSILSAVKYGLVGLCDSSYPKFNLAGRKLNKRLQQLGATSLLSPCEADEQGQEGTEGAFLEWLLLFQEQVLLNFPLQAGQTQVPAGHKLPSEWLLAKATTDDQCTSGFRNGEHIVSAKISKYSPELSFPVVLERNERVTPSDHWQDVRLLRLRAMEAINYMPGDVLALRPQNLPEDVNQIISLLDWQDMADTKLKLQSTRSMQGPDDVFDPMLRGLDSVTLRQLLTEYLDIYAVPRRSFFSKIAHFTEDEVQKERALEFTEPQYLDEYFDYATRPRRGILEVLQEFHTVKIPWQEAINTFPLLRPRQFSVASGGHLKADGFCFELLVAIVKYRTVIKRIREGVCTKYLAQLPVGTRLNVVLHTEGRFHNRLADMDRPHLLIGGGTGIAPLRSVILEKSAFVGAQATSLLIFGCRNSHSDYFFSTDWSKLESQEQSSFRVIPAFSRDQDRKIYVQDRILQHAELIREILSAPNSILVVCGSSGAMPKAVRQALKDVLASTTEAAAENYLVQLEKEGRYKQETW